MPRLDEEGLKRLVIAAAVAAYISSTSSKRREGGGVVEVKVNPWRVAARLDIAEECCLD